jgi:hypothetical protein
MTAATLRTFESAAAVAIYDAINAVDNREGLEHIARELWKGWGEGLISDGDAEFLSSYIERRRPINYRMAPHTPAFGALAGRIASRFTTRRRQRSPDRAASRERRRVLGGSSALPPDTRRHFTEGERAVLCVVSGEVKHQGVCDWAIDKIAAAAGVCRSTTQNALHEARRLGLIKITERPQRGWKNLSNVVEIISREWLIWLHRAPSAARRRGSNFFSNAAKKVNPTRSTARKKEEATDKNEVRLGQSVHSPPSTRATG